MGEVGFSGAGGDRAPVFGVQPVRPGQRFPSLPGLASAAVIVVFLAGIVFFIGGNRNAGPGPVASGTERPSPGSTVLPSSTVSRTAQPTMEPTAEPTPTAGIWAGIDWSAPFDPLPYKPPTKAGQPATTFAMYDMTTWGGEYVGAGSISRGSECDAAVFVHSADQTQWTITNRFSSGEQRTATSCPRFVIGTTFGLLALSESRLWTSKDGIDWTGVDSPSWHGLWTTGMPELIAVAAGPDAVVVVGAESWLGPSVVASSADGSTWQRAQLPADEQAIVRDVAFGRSGFVLVGRDGQPDRESYPAGIVPGVGRPAAWISRDGTSWTAAQVEGSPVQAGVLTRVLVGADGLFAIGNDTASAVDYPDGQYDAGHTVTAWTSSDGATWNVAGTLGKDLPPMGGLIASDGTRMVALGVRQSAAWTGIEGWVEQEPTAWSSTDGRDWSALAVSGEAPEVDFLVLEPMLTGSPPDGALWILGDRLLALGRGDGVPVNQPYADQWFRFGTIGEAGD
jgi:hypothetical protein